MTGDETTQGAKDAPEPGGGGAGVATDVHSAGPAAEEYLEGVRAALADLPASEVAEILDDVRAHLTDLTAELGGDDTAALTARLGPPSAYAAELRAAAGYPAAPEPARSSRRWPARLAIAGLAASTLLVPLSVAAPAGLLLVLVPAGIGVFLIMHDGPGVPSVAALPEVRRLAALRPATGTTARTGTDFLASLQPGWWVARAFVAACLLVAVLDGGGVAVAVLLTLFAAPILIWLGNRTRRDRRWLWAVVPLNVLAAMVLLVLLTEGANWFGGSSPRSTPAVHLSGLWQDSEREIRDIRPVDAAGNPLTGVYLFDQDGRPIDTSGGVGCDLGYGEGRPGYAADGSSVESNAPYPRGTWDYDQRTGDCRFTPPGPLVIAVPSTTAPAAAPTAVLPPVGPMAPPTTDPAQGSPSVLPTTGPPPPSPVSPSAPTTGPPPPRPVSPSIPAPSVGSAPASPPTP